MPQLTPPQTAATSKSTQLGESTATQSATSPPPPKLLGGALLYPTLAIVGCTCLTWALRRRSSSKNKKPDISAEQIATVAELHSLRSDLNELGERLAKQLDRKAGHIEELLARAEQATEKLRLLQGSTSQAGTRHPEWAQNRRDGFIETAAPLDPLHARVAELADQGLTPVQIAQRLEQPTGQIELILALRRRYVRT